MRYFKLFIIFFIFIHCKNTNNSTVYPLNGEWQYRIGFDIEWLSDSGQESDWKKISLPANLTAELKLNSYTGYITVRRELPSALNLFLKQGKPLAINAGRVLDVSYFYFNKTLIGQLGSSDPYISGAMRPFLKDIPFTDLNYEKNYLTIVLYTNNGNYPLQFMDTIEIGESDSIYVSYTKKENLAFFFIAIYVAVGLYHILLANKRRKDLHNLYFGLFCFCVCIHFFIANTFSRDAIFQDSVTLHRKLEHIFMFPLTPGLLLFLTQFFDKKNTKIAKGFALFSTLLIVVTLIFPLTAMRICSLLWQIGNIFLVPYMIYYLIQQIRKGNREAIYLISGLIILGIGMVLDIATSRGLIHTPHVSSFAFLLFIMGIAGIMANRFMHVTNEVEILNEELEKKVEDRTKELRESLTETQKLKEQQDGDYYLTSLLVQPLSRNFIKEKKSDFKIETFIQQKKQFQFKNKKSEIGGDICIIDEIILDGITFTVFLNGDAMGKSIQGAGGCLVLGTVFKSILERNHTKPDTRNIPPEIWMRESFRELQNVFVSFDGSMLISAMYGLIDNRNGTVYYINAEHPYSVLYRDGRATFIDPETDKRKIGIEVFNSSLKIHIFQLKPGDSLICGSDGRDDILIGEDKSGSRIINEDETVFLKLTEEANADLTKLTAILKTRGELTDDLSLLKITYEKNQMEETSPIDLKESEKGLKEAYQYYLHGLKEKTISTYEKVFLIKKDPELIMEIVHLFIEKKDFFMASRLLDIYCKENPFNSNAFYLNSFAKKKNREYERAVYFGERFRLREPLHVKNLINLSDCYRMLDQLDNARKYLSRALKLEPTNKNALKLQDNIL
ncbi:MAG: SpoIIE family protein phosphatase [Leptospiraceae bacterium]|nr:SpoIIE family protein phosphatase [Leptospiraceae bacterium]